MAVIENIHKHIGETEALLDSVQDMKNDPLIWGAFYEHFLYRFCWSSNSLEGNTLTLDETVAVVDFDEVSAGHTFREYQEAKSLYKAIREMRPDGLELSETWIKKVNGMICGTDGGYRQEDVFIGSTLKAVYYPPKHGDVPGLMQDYMEGLRAFDGKAFIDIVTETVNRHICFERIHPFQEGNGRTGRIVMNQMLLNHGVLPAAIEHTSKYRQAFRVFDRQNDTSLMTYLLCDALNQSANALIAYSQKRERDQDVNSAAAKEKESVLNKLEHAKSQAAEKAPKKERPSKKPEHGH